MPLSDEQLQEAWRRGVIREADRLGLYGDDVDRDLPVLRMTGWREIEAAVRADQIGTPEQEGKGDE